MSSTNAKPTGKSLNETGPVTEVAEVRYHEGHLMLPNGMEIPGAIDLLERRQKYLEEKVNINEVFNVFPYDGAHAIAQVFIKMFGWVPSVATPGFWGPTPPQMVTIAVGPGQTAEVPWGRFSLPGVKGWIDCGVGIKNGMYQFKLDATVLRKDEATIRKVYNALREYLKKNSIYKGKAIKIRFLDDEGDKLAMPEPSFLETDHISREMLIYSDSVMSMVETNLFAPIERVADCELNGIPIKRGVLLAGVYGTGKTLAATVASRLAVDNGITYLYVPRAEELSLALEFAKQYQSPAAVIFCEDVDRVMSGERSVEMDDILNIIDGIDSKGGKIITVLTTNDLEAINPAMIRPGRLDAVIEVTPPDAKAVEKLLRYYGGTAINADTELEMAGQALAGHIPATISEVIKRAKLVQMRLNPKGQMVSNLSEEAVLEAALTMKAQSDLLNKKIANAKAPTPTVDSTMRSLVAELVSESTTAIKKTVVENA